MHTIILHFLDLCCQPPNIKDADIHTSRSKMEERTCCSCHGVEWELAGSSGALQKAAHPRVSGETGAELTYIGAIWAFCLVFKNKRCIQPYSQNLILNRWHKWLPFPQNLNKRSSLAAFNRREQMIDLHYMIQPHNKIDPSLIDPGRFQDFCSARGIIRMEYLAVAV